MFGMIPFAGFNGPFWQNLKVGAGGWVVGMDVHADGSKLARPDKIGVYLLDSNGHWNQLVTTQSLPANTYGFNSSGIYIQGVSAYDARFDPSNSSTIWMKYNGWMFKSTNEGQSWNLLSGYTRDSANQTVITQDGYRMAGQRLAVDPNNPNICYIGTPGVGVYFTIDGGTTWNEIPNSSVPTGSTLYSGICFDPASGTTGGATNKIYIAVWGSGVYHTSNAGSSWSLLSGSPQAVGHARVNSGNYYCNGKASSAGLNGVSQQLTDLYKWNGSIFSSIRTDPSISVDAFDIDPNNSLHIVYVNGFSATFETTDGGTIWTAGGGSAASLIATDIPWLALGGLSGPGEVYFDPLVANKYWLSAGTGVWTATSNPIGSPQAYTSQSAFIEQLVATRIIAAPGGAPVVSVQDRQEFYLSPLNKYPSTYGDGVNHLASIDPCYALDFGRASSPQTIVALNQTGGLISSNGGANWSALSNSPTSPGKGGAVAVSTSTNFVAIQNDSATNVQYTLDGGSTAWSSASGLFGGSIGGSVALPTPLCADAVTAGTFYLYDLVNGVYKSTDGGATWSNVHGTLVGNYKAIPYLVAVPANSGHLFFTMGIDNGAGDVRPGNPFYQSINNGSTWTSISNVQDVVAVAIGATAPAGAYPTIYIEGWVNQGSGYQYGVWRSIDECSTWQLLIAFPNSSVDLTTTMAADATTWNICYIGKFGSGFIIGQNL